MTLCASSAVRQTRPVTYYRDALATVHHLGYGLHGDACAPGVLALLKPMAPGPVEVLELGCGSGALTRHLVAAGHHVTATDASPAMVDLPRLEVPQASPTVVVLPDDPLPLTSDPAGWGAVVSVGHVLSYLPDEAAIRRALAAAAGALRPGGVLAVDLCDLSYASPARLAPHGRKGDGWAIVTEFSSPSPDRWVRDMAVFTEQPDGSWHRDDEVHVNVLVDTASVPGWLAEVGVDAEVSTHVGDHQLPDGMVWVVGRKRV